MYSLIIKASILFSLYIIAAYSTTDITRLLSVYDHHSVSSKDSYCPYCHHSLSLFDQIPIFSYYIKKGCCSYCKAKIPPLDHKLEVGLFSSMTIVTLISGFSMTGFLLCVLIYELTKVFLLVKYKIRHDHMLREIATSVGYNLFLFGMLGLFFMAFKLV